MKNIFINKKRMSALILALLLALQLAACGNGNAPLPSANVEASNPQQEASEEEKAPELQADTAQAEALPEKEPFFFKNFDTDKQYLLAYFGINADSELNADSFSDALKAVSGMEELNGPDVFDMAAALTLAVDAAGYSELAGSYTQQKTEALLQSYGLGASSGDPVKDAYILSGLDAGLYGIDEAKTALAGGDISKESAAMVLMAVASACGNGRNYLGFSDDPDIGTKLNHMWNTFFVFDDPALTEIGREAVEKGITTGYGLKYDGYNSNFLPDLTLQYNHDTIKHAIQLMALLNSEGISALVSLEPNIGVYQYMTEWGPIPDSTPTYEVREFDADLYLVFAVSYDLLLEFRNVDEMLRFDEVVRTYAKKNGDNKDAIGLIYASWWQPLYTTTRTDMPAEEYYKLHDCVVRNGAYSIHPFCLDAKFDETVAKMDALNKDFSVEAVTRYCNKAFYNYLTGEDYQ